MRYPLGAIGVAALPVETGRVATGCCLVALQSRAVAGSAGIKTVHSRIAAVIKIRIRPARRMNRKWWLGIVGVTTVAADGIATTAQIRGMTLFTISITGVGKRFRRMGGEPALGMGVIVGRGIRTATGTSAQ